MQLIEKIQFRYPHLRALLKPSSFAFNPIFYSGKGEKKDLVEFDSRALKSTFNEFGSDKSKFHDYHIPYSWILSKLTSRASILEVGIGTNNPTLPSNMGVLGKPGASLRGWRELKMFTHVVGADIDRNCLFNEDGISTYFVDQLSEKELSKFTQIVTSQFEFNLIIDDGLHTSEANILTFIHLWPLLNVGGFYVIEDIRECDLVKTLIEISRDLLPEQISIWANPGKSDDNTLIIISK